MFGYQKQRNEQHWSLNKSYKKIENIMGHNEKYAAIEQILVLGIAMMKGKQHCQNCHWKTANLRTL